MLVSLLISLAIKTTVSLSSDVTCAPELLGKRSGSGERYYSESPSGGLSERISLPEIVPEEAWELEERTIQVMQSDDRRRLSQIRRDREQARTEASSSTSRYGRVRRAYNRPPRQENPRILAMERNYRYTGMSLGIPAYFESFLVNGEFPPETPLPESSGDESPSDFEERLAIERANENEPYYNYEFRYARKDTRTFFPLDAWQRLLANRNPKALKLRGDYLERALWILDQTRKVLLEMGKTEESTCYLEEEYAYARMLFRIYHEEDLSSSDVFNDQLSRLDPFALEAKAMFGHVCSQPWLTLEEYGED